MDLVLTQTSDNCEVSRIFQQVEANDALLLVVSLQALLDSTKQSKGIIEYQK